MTIEEALKLLSSSERQALQRAFDNGTNYCVAVDDEHLLAVNSSMEIFQVLETTENGFVLGKI